MPTFKRTELNVSVVPNGTYLAKVIEARERTSSNGNPMIAMKLQLAGADVLPCILTFVDKARAAITAFCQSADLVLPADKDADINLAAADCLGRYLYVTVINEDDGQGGDPFPKIVRFLTREAALIKNPQLARICYVNNFR
jgi:hypothetical protein